MLFWSRSDGWEGVEFGLDAVAEFGGYVVIAGHVFGVKDGEGVFDGFQGGGDGWARTSRALRYAVTAWASRSAPSAPWVWMPWSCRPMARLFWAFAQSAP